MRRSHGNNDAAAWVRLGSGGCHNHRVEPGVRDRLNWLNAIRAGVLAGFVAAIIPAPGCDRASSAPASSEREGVAVTVTTPVPHEMARTIQASGTLFGDEQATISAKVSGRVVEVLADLGDVVKPGDPLVRIDPVDYALARDERRSAFVQALARVGLSELPPEDFEVSSLPSVERARLQMENAKARYERGKTLAERQPPLISQQDYADLQTAWEVARSNQDVERLQAEATLAEARTLQSQLRMAEQRLHDTLHVAPRIVRGEEPSAAADDPERRYDVAERLVSVGDFMQIGSPLLRLVDADPVKLRAHVPERRLGAVRVDQAVKVRVDSEPEPFLGRVWRVSPAVDVATRNFIVEILIANPEGRLKPGSFAIADIEIGRETALCVPESSVITFAGVNKVVLVREGKAAEQRIELGERSNGSIEVRKGLEADDQVVVRPSASLTTGTPVTIANAGPTAAVAAPSPASRGGGTTP